MPHQSDEKVYTYGEGLLLIDTPDGVTAEGRDLLIKGRAWPSTAEIQVLVLSADGWWYQQKTPKRNRFFRSRWTCDVKIGAEVPHSDTYYVAAGLGCRIHADKVQELPTDRLWTGINVHRWRAQP